MTKHEIIEKVMAAKEKLAGRRQKTLQAPASPPAPAEEGRLRRWRDWLLRHKKLCVSAVALCLAAAVGLQAVLRGPAEPASGYQYIRTTTLQKTSLANSVTATGTVASASTANVTVTEGAETYKIATVNVEVGDVVKKGDVIATLDTSDLEIANKIARAIRAANGGFKYCKAIGVMLSDRNTAQVSMNMVNYEGTPLYYVFEMIRALADRYGARIIGSELVGLTPAKALLDCAEYYLKLENFDCHKQVMEYHLIGME